MLTAEKWDNLYSQHQNYQSASRQQHQNLDIFVNLLVLLHLKIWKPRHLTLEWVMLCMEVSDFYVEISAYNYRYFEFGFGRLWSEVRLCKTYNIFTTHWLTEVFKLNYVCRAILDFNLYFCANSVSGRELVSPLYGSKNHQVMFFTGQTQWIYQSCLKDNLETWLLPPPPLWLRLTIESEAERVEAGEVQVPPGPAPVHQHQVSLLLLHHHLALLTPGQRALCSHLSSDLSSEQQ